MENLISALPIFLSIAAFVFSIWSFLNTRNTTLRQLKSSTYAAVMDRLSEINRLELEYPELFEQLYNDFDETTAQQDVRLKHYVFMLFNLWAEIYAQHEKFGFFDKEEMDVWARRLEYDFHKRSFLRGYWKLERTDYPYTQTYVKFINRALEKAEASLVQGGKEGAVKSHNTWSHSEKVSMSDTDKITILWNAYADEQEWQRHNENQRAQLTNILLIISAALVAFLSDNMQYSNWLVPTFLIATGVLGILAVIKYWERFMFHTQCASVYWETLDSYFVQNTQQFNEEDRFMESKNLLAKIDEEAMKRHEKRWLPLLKDRYFMQHWLWEGVFGLITLLGIVLLIGALSS